MNKYKRIFLVPLALLLMGSTYKPGATSEANTFKAIAADDTTANITLTGSSGNITLTGTVDGIDIAIDVAANTAKVSADGSVATHSDVSAAQATAIGNLSNTNTGDLTIGTANGLSLCGQAISLAQSTACVTGSLSNTDWTTFNGKQDALTFGANDYFYGNACGAFTSLAGIDGNMLTWDACGVPAIVVTGTCGQVMTSNGVGTAPTFQDHPLMIKSGVEAFANFACNPKKATITFAAAFDDANYSITATDGDGRIITYESKVAGSVVLNLNANIAPTVDVIWIAIEHGEN